MSDSKPTPPTEKEAIGYARKWAAEGLPPGEIFRRLVDRGVDRGIAHFVVTEKSGAIEQVQSKAGRRQMMIGGIILCIGVAVTLVTYLTTDTAGGRFIIAYGAMFVGAAQLIRGYVLSRGE